MKYEFTMEEIKEIYYAGMRWGIEDQVAYDHGTRAKGNPYRELIDVLHDIWNKDKTLNDPDYTIYLIVEKIVEKENGKTSQTSKET